MAELMANTSAYMTAGRIGGGTAPTFLPTIGTMQGSFQPYDTYPAPTTLRRSITTLPWRPSTYYGSARINTTIPNAYSMPEPLSETNSLTQLDSIKVPPIFAAARNALYTRYTPNDWMTSNVSNYLASDKVRVGSERVRLDASRLCRELDDKTKGTQEDVGKKLGDRLGDIQYWKTEVQHETDNMLTEIEALGRAKAALDKTLVETEIPLHIAQECLYNREKRQGIDLVHDNVERVLIKEVDNIKRCQDDLRRLIQTANNQLSLDRAAQHELEKDFGDKNIAMRLDGVCHQLRNTSRGINFHDGIERVDNTTSVPLSWAEFSNYNIQRSQSERTASANVRANIAQLVQQVADAIADHWNNVNEAFADRLKEYIDARNRLQNHLAKVLQEIFEMEKNIELLRRSIIEKEAPMQVAQTRLVTRVRRPNVEACRDQVQFRLVEEVYEINETVDQLRVKLRESESALQHLLRQKLSLEHDLEVKNNSILIDREKCMGLRKNLPMVPQVAVY